MAACFCAMKEKLLTKYQPACGYMDREMGNCEKTDGVNGFHIDTPFIV